MSRKGTIFPRGFREGDPLARRGVNKGLNLMAKFWETLDIAGGYIDWSNDRPLIIPPAQSTNEGVGGADHYFLCEQEGEDGVTVQAGATQTVGDDPVEREGAGTDGEFLFPGLTTPSVIYAHYKRNEMTWDATTSPDFLKIASGLPESDRDNDYRLIAYIGFEDGAITHIEQAHVGVLRVNARKDAFFLAYAAEDNTRLYVSAGETQVFNEAAEVTQAGTWTFGTSSNDAIIYSVWNPQEQKWEGTQGILSRTGTSQYGSTVAVPSDTCYPIKIAEVDVTDGIITAIRQVHLGTLRPPYDPTKHYFLVEKEGADGVTVRAGATQQIGSDPVARVGSGGDEFVVENLTESSVLYAHYKRDTGDWDTASPGFIKIAAIASLPTSDGENDYRPIAYITVEGTGTEGDPYKVTEIEQAHVGVLREPYPAYTSQYHVLQLQEDEDTGKLKPVWDVLRFP